MIKIVESGVSGHNWYRKYSDGWIEQGGFVPTIMETNANSLTAIFFNIPFANVCCNLRVTSLKLSNTSDTGAQLCLTTWSRERFSVVADSYKDDVYGYYWEANGY